MNREIEFRVWKTIIISFLLCVFCFPAFALDDPNPDSPTPVLLSDLDSSRVLAVNEKSWNGGLPKSGEKVFFPGRNNVISLFVTNLDLMEGEGANAFRVYLYQPDGKVFTLETVGFERATKTVYALKVRLQDQYGYRGQPAASGDSAIFLTWRGLASNPLKIALGSTGGDIRLPDFSGAGENNPSADLVGYRWSGDRVRFLEQATFGPTTELDNRIRRIGLRTWLAEQFAAPYPTIEYPNIPLKPTAPQSDCQLTTNPVCYREHYSMQPVQKWFFREAFYGDSQLRHRMAWTLNQILVTSGVQIQQSSHMIAYHKILSENAFGNYRELLYDVTLSPTMGDYLDMVRSTKNNPNENYAREILQLFSIGLFMLNQDGTLQLDGQGNPIPTYDQNTVNNFAKVFTGWTYCNSNNPEICPNWTAGTLDYKDPMRLNPANHDLTQKNLLNYPNAPHPVIEACANCANSAEITAYANDSLNKTIDNIFNHPNTAPYISKLLIQHLVMSDPSPAYVGRVSAVFANNGSGERGDLKAVLRAILLDPEARGNIKTAPRYGKLREPVQILTNLGRLFPARSYDGTMLSDGGFSYFMNRMAQDPFYSPTVFNYYPPDYIVPGTTLNAPEFNLLNTGTGVNRTNFLYVLIFEGLVANVTDTLRGTSLDLSEAVAYSEMDASGNELMNYINNKMLHGAMSPAHRTAVLNAVLAVPSSNPQLRVKTAVYLIAASSQYQIQR